MMKCLSLLLFAGILPGQHFGVGVKGGVRLTGDLNNYSGISESKRYAVGPMVTAGLPLGFRLEVGALYRRVGFRTSDTDITGGFHAERDTGNSWEFPIVVRRTLWRGVYAGVGYAPRVINGAGHVDAITVTSLFPLAKIYREYDIPGSWDTTHGIVGAAGIEKRIGPLRIAPEIRYTHWSRPAVDESGSHGFSIQSTQDQVDLLIGIGFR